MVVFNSENTAYETKSYPLFLGQEMAIHDSVNLQYKKVNDLLMQQISQRWLWNEFNHEQSRLDMTTCPKGVYDIMLMNLAYQHTLDSVASRAIAPLFAPFVTNSELWAAMVKFTNMEVCHAMSYSEIVRQCVKDPKEVFEMSVKNEHVLSRASTIVKAFNELQKAGAEYTLGLRKNDQDTYNVVFKGVVALLILERLSFMASFSATFAVVEQGYFQSIGKKVQKIMIDEIVCHYALDSEMINIELSTERGKKAYEQCKDEILQMINESLRNEYEWSAYMFSEGRSIVGLNEELMNRWVEYNAQYVYQSLKLLDKMPFDWQDKNPLPWMDNWIDIDKVQNAMQELDGNNYALNTVKDDIGESEFDF